MNEDVEDAIAVLVDVIGREKDGDYRDEYAKKLAKLIGALDAVGRDAAYHKGLVEGMRAELERLRERIRELESMVLMIPRREAT